MKQLTCEMCGSTDLIKQDGVFVCQTCGCKYSLEEARKMMVEGTVEVTGTVKVDNSAAIANYLKLAQSALDASNQKEAEDYANKIIELAPRHSEAWLIKGEAAGWQSSAANPRLTDAVTAWLNAIEYADNTDRGKLREAIAEKFTHLMLAMISLRCKNFGTIPSAENDKTTKTEVSNCVTLMNTLMTKGGVSFNRAFIYNQIADMLNKAAVAGYKDASKDFGDFGTNHSSMSKWQWERYTASGDSCLSILSYALNYVRDTSLGRTICDNLVSIGESVRDSCSWKFDVNSWTADHHVREYSFTQGAKDSRTKSISGWKQKKDEFDIGDRSKALSIVQGGRVKEEETAARTRYWEDHTEDKLALEKERNTLQERIGQMSDKLRSLSVLSEIQVVEDEIAEIKKTLSGLGFFKGKEKKALQARIDESQSKLSQLQARRKQDEAPILSEIQSTESRIAEIDEEFSKSRGRIPADEVHYIFDNAIKDGKLNITPNMVLECFKEIATDEFQPSIERTPVAAFSELGDSWLVSFKNPKRDKDNQSVGAPIQLYAESPDSPISVIVIPAHRNVDSAVSLCNEASRLLLAITNDETISKDDLEEKLCDLIYNKDRSLFVYGQLRVEYAAFFIEMLGISLPFAFAVIRVND